MPSVRMGTPTVLLMGVVLAIWFPDLVETILHQVVVGSVLLFAFSKLLGSHHGVDAAISWGVGAIVAAVVWRGAVSAIHTASPTRMIPAGWSSDAMYLLMMFVAGVAVYLLLMGWLHRPMHAPPPPRARRRMGVVDDLLVERSPRTRRQGDTTDDLGLFGGSDD